jgi:hypothetical protein
MLAFFRGQIFLASPEDVLRDRGILQVDIPRPRDHDQESVNTVDVEKAIANLPKSP